MTPIIDETLKGLKIKCSNFPLVSASDIEKSLFFSEQESLIIKTTITNSLITSLTIFDMGGMIVPQNVVDHCAETLRRRKLKLCDF